VVDEARQQLAAAGGRRRRRGRNATDTASEPLPAEATAGPARKPSVAVEITPLPVGLREEPLITVSVPSHDPSPSRDAVPQVTAAPTPEPTPEVDDAGEPRRRRRRSSAAG
jgi:ribonuclease E